MAYQYFSGLFNNMNKNNDSLGLQNIYQNLGDYRTIQSGSYRKLLNAYCKKEDTTEQTTNKKAEVSKKTTKTTDTKAYTDLKKVTDQAVKSAEDLVGSKNADLYTEEKQEECLKKVKDFANSYNQVLTNAKDTGNQSIENARNTMVSQTKSYENELKEIGITIDEKTNKLQVDEEAFLKSDSEKIKKLCNAGNSFVGATMRLESNVGSVATNAVVGLKTYGASGAYNVVSNSELFDRLL